MSRLLKMLEELKAMTKITKTMFEEYVAINNEINNKLAKIIE